MITIGVNDQSVTYNASNCVNQNYDIKSKVTESVQSFVAQDKVFNGGHNLWLSMQNRVETFVNKHGGRAKRTTPYTTKGSWSKISSFYKL